MTTRKTGDQALRYKKTEAALLDLIKNRRFEGDRLPSEEALCSLMDVGRTTVREALASLARKGFISKIHGSGNLIHESTLAARMRIDTHIGFKTLLEDGGYRVDFRREAPRWLTRREAAGLDLSDVEEERFFLIANTYYADGKPAIYTRNYLCGSFVDPEAEKAFALGGSFYELLKSVLIEEVANSINRFRPSAAEAEIAAILDLELGEPLIQWFESYIGIYDHLLCKSLISFNPRIVDLTMLRRWE